MTKLTASLTKTVTPFNLVRLRADHNTWCDTFLTFKNSLEDVMSQHAETAHIMFDYPELPKRLSSVTNEALSAFLYANMAGNVKNLMSSIDRGDGLNLLKRLQTMYASATPADRSRAYQQLHELKMHPSESAQAFISRFRGCIQVLLNTTMKNAKCDMPSDSELATLVIDKLYNDSLTVVIFDSLLWIVRKLSIATTPSLC